jgi:hypothetical protein
MKKIFIISILNLFSILNATTLQELYDNAVSGEGYQKFMYSWKWCNNRFNWIFNYG